jgi:hypothetical protein
MYLLLVYNKRILERLKLGDYIYLHNTIACQLLCDLTTTLTLPNHS